jgi:hypothetical protein
MEDEPGDWKLAEMVQLQELDCRETDISDLEPLRQLTSLQQLYCGDNQISDLKLRRQLTSLRILAWSENQISQWEIDNFKNAVPGCSVLRRSVGYGNLLFCWKMCK